jgi:hypothetical protein
VAVEEPSAIVGRRYLPTGCSFPNIVDVVDIDPESHPDPRRFVGWRPSPAAPIVDVSDR